MPATKSERTLEPPEEERGCSLAIKLLPKITWDRAEADAAALVTGNAGFSVRKFEFCELQAASELDWEAWEPLYSESPFGSFSAPCLTAWIFGSRVAVETGLVINPGMSSNDGPLPDDTVGT